MKNNITSKYLWKRSTLYPFPLIFDISLNVHLVSPMGKKEHKNRHVTMVHLRIQLRRTIFLKDIKYEMNYIKHLHFTAVKHCFFSNSMSLSDVLSENLLPLPYIYCIYIYIWLVVSNIFVFHFIYGIICPIDFHIFSRWLKPPTKMHKVYVLIAFKWH